MATKNIVPNADTEGQLGTSTKGWGKIFLGGTAANIDVNDVSGTNTAGKSLTLISGASTGSGSGGSIVFQTAAAGGSGTSVNSHATVLTLDSAKLATFTGGLDIAGAVDIAGDLTLSAGADGALNFSAASSIKILDNSATSLVIEEADTAYMTFVTTNSSEAIKFDKALDINAAVQLDSTLTVGVNDTGYDVKFFGATSGKSLLWDEGADSLIVTGTTDLIGTTNLDIVDIDGAVNMATTALVTGVLTTTATQVANGGITSGSNIVSDTDSTDSLGTTSVRWANLFVDAITATNNLAVGGTGAFTGNVKIGSQDFPAFNNNRNVLVIGQKGSLSSINSSGDIYLNQNVFVDSSGANKAIASGGSAQFRLSDSEILISTGTSPGAGATTVLTPRLTISSTLSTFANNIKIPNSGTIGCAADANLLTLTDQVLTVAGNVVSSGRLLVTAADGVSNADYVASIRNQEATDGSSFGLTINAGSNASDIALNITDHDAANVLLRVFGNGNSTFGGDLSINGGDLSFSADQNATIGMGQRNDGGRNLDIGAGGAGNGGGSNSNGGSLTLRSGGSKGTGTSTMHFRTSVAANGYGLSTEQMKIDAVGDVSVTNNLFIGSGKAIYVGGTAADNAFDDYEEGTWNPLPFYQNADDQGKALVDQVTANQTAGFYTKIGNMVHVHGSIVWNISEGLSDIAVDNVGVKTLPFASANQTNNFSAITFAINGANTVPSGGFTGELSKNSAILLISSPSQSGNQGRNLGTGDITVKFSCSYRATT